MQSFLQFSNEFDAERVLIESMLDEMANLTPDDTGLPYVLWMGEVGGQHGPRIKVCNVRGKMQSNNCFVLSVAHDPVLVTPKSCKLSPSEVEDIKDWIRLNYDVLMKMWKVYETGTGSLIALQNELTRL